MQLTQQGFDFAYLNYIEKYGHPRVEELRNDISPIDLSSFGTPEGSQSPIYRQEQEFQFYLRTDPRSDQNRMATEPRQPNRGAAYYVEQAINDPGIWQIPSPIRGQAGENFPNFRLSPLPQNVLGNMSAISPITGQNDSTARARPSTMDEQLAQDNAMLRESLIPAVPGGIPLVMPGGRGFLSPMERHMGLSRPTQLVDNSSFASPIAMPAAPRPPNTPIIKNPAVEGLNYDHYTRIKTGDTVLKDFHSPPQVRRRT
jgi:hypothetical protein